MSRVRLRLWLAPALLCLSASVAMAQDFQPIDEGEGQMRGNPLYGYVATAFLGAGAMFVLCKSSRR